MSTLTTIAGITGWREPAHECETAVAYRAPGYPTACHWQCEECGEVTEMTTEQIVANAKGSRPEPVQA